MLSRTLAAACWAYRLPKAAGTAMAGRAAAEMPGKAVGTRATRSATATASKNSTPHHEQAGPAVTTSGNGPQATVPQNTAAWRQ